MNPTSPAPSSPKDLQQQLDDALADSFPASDPVSFVTSQVEEYWAENGSSGDNDADGGARDASGVKTPAE